MPARSCNCTEICWSCEEFVFRLIRDIGLLLWAIHGDEIVNRLKAKDRSQNNRYEFPGLRGLIV